MNLKNNGKGKKVAKDYSAWRRFCKIYKHLLFHMQWVDPYIRCNKSIKT